MRGGALFVSIHLSANEAKAHSLFSALVISVFMISQDQADDTDGQCGHEMHTDLFPGESKAPVHWKIEGHGRHEMIHCPGQAIAKNPHG